MVKFRLNGFIALILVAGLVGVLQGMPLEDMYESVLNGIGSQLDELVLILGFGAMLGRILADSGAAQRIATSMTNFFGIGRVQLAMVLSAFAIGITMFYEVGFVILIPLVFTIVRENRLPLLWVGLPMSIALSTMHSFLPPHPGPAAVSGTFHASMALTLLYGLVIALPASALIAFTWPRLPFIKRMNPSIPRGLIAEEDFPEADLPSFATCLGLVLVPIVLMGALATAEVFLPEGNVVLHFLSFFGEAPVALLISLLIATAVLGDKVALAERRRTALATAATPVAVTGGGAGDPGPEPDVDTTRPTFAERAAAVGRSCTDSIKPMAIIILITDGWHVSPIILAWGIAALMRVALGSATVAVVTAAGVVLPLVDAGGVSPELMVLAVTCGSIFASHVNDPGFWLFKEFFNLSVIEAIKSRTSYSTVLSILGLGGVLALSAFVG